MTEHSGEKDRPWRGMSNHNVRRFAPDGPVLAPCFCWATSQHDMGDEMSIPYAQSGDES